jgi:hypothetical protein
MINQSGDDEEDGQGCQFSVRGVLFLKYLNSKIKGSQKIGQGGETSEKAGDLFVSRRDAVPEGRKVLKDNPAPSKNG